MNYKQPAHVLIIDDDEINNFIAERLIHKASKNTKITICLNGREALTKLSELRDNDGILPEYIFLDLTMQVMDGWGFLDAYRHLEKNPTRVIILTSSVFRHDINRASKHEVETEYIIKPLSSERLNELFAQ